MQPINDFSKYLIDRDGRVFSTISNKYLKPTVFNVGYYYLTLINDNGLKKKVALHRLLANTFIPNPYNKPEVNHRDGNKLNNSLGNLEWVTPSENIRNAIPRLKNKNCIDYADIPNIIEQLQQGSSWVTLAEQYEVNSSGLRKLIKRDFERRGKDLEFKELCNKVANLPARKGNRGRNQTTTLVKVTYPDDSSKIFKSINETARFLGCNPAKVFRAINSSNKQYKNLILEKVGHDKN